MAQTNLRGVTDLERGDIEHQHRFRLGGLAQVIVGQLLDELAEVVCALYNPWLSDKPFLCCSCTQFGLEGFMEH